MAYMGSREGLGGNRQLSSSIFMSPIDGIGIADLFLAQAYSLSCCTLTLNKHKTSRWLRLWGVAIYWFLCLFKVKVQQDREYACALMPRQARGITEYKTYCVFKVEMGMFLDTITFFLQGDRGRAVRGHRGARVLLRGGRVALHPADPGERQPLSHERHRPQRPQGKEAEFKEGRV